MRVLILRPEPQAGAMAATLSGYGIRSTVAPMLSIEANPDAAALVVDQSPAVILLTSPNGAAALSGPDAQTLHGLPVVAVGPATARAAADAGFRDVREADGDVEAVADHVRRSFAPGVGRIVHAAGRDRAGDAAGVLQAAGYDVCIVEVYRAEASASLPSEVLEDLGKGAFDAVIVGSARTASAFRRSLEAAALELGRSRPAVVAISAAAAAPLQPDFDRIVLAERPIGEDLTKAVVALAATLDLNARAGDAEISEGGSTEEATTMAAGSDRRGPGPFDKGGRRQAKPTTIDLTATEVGRPDDDEAGHSSGGETPDRSAAADETAGFTVPPEQKDAGPDMSGEPKASDAEGGPDSRDGDETMAGKSTDPDRIFVSDVLSGSEQPAAAGAENAPGERADAGDMAAPSEPPSADGSAESGGATPSEPPPRVAAAEYPPRKSERGAFRLVAAALVGGVVALGGAAALYSRGAITPPVDEAAQTELAGLRSDLATLSNELQALREQPSAPSTDPLLAARIADVETALQGLPAAPADQTPAVEDLRSAVADLSGRLGELEAQPSPADPTDRIEALAGDLAAVQSEIEAVRSGQEAAATVIQEQQAAVEAQRSALQEQQAAVEQQRTSVEELAARPLPPSVDPARVDQLEQSLRQSLSDLSERIGGLDRTITERVGSVEQTVADARQAAQSATEETRAAVSELSGRLDPISEEIRAIDERLAAVEERLANAPREGEIAALSLAVTTLTSKVDAGEPFAADLAILKSTSDQLPDLSALDAAAESGVPTLETIEATFPLSAITTTRPAEAETGLVDRVVIGAKSLVNYRETGQNVTDPLSVPLADLTAALDAGDLERAAAAWDALPDFARDRSAEWKSQLDQRIAADAAVDSLTETLLSRLQAAAGEPSPAPAN